MFDAKQCQHFETFGYVVLPQLFTPDEIAGLYEDSVRTGVIDTAAAPTRRVAAAMLGPHAPTFTSLIEDDRLVHKAEQLFGNDVIGVGAEASQYIGDTRWHADAASYDHAGIKFIFYFEPLTAATGALRVLPGSHHKPLYDAFSQFVRAAASKPGAVPDFAFDCQPGDVLAYDLRLHHASYGGRPGRSGGSIFYYQNPRTAAQRHALHEWDVLSRRKGLEYLPENNVAHAPVATGALRNPAYIDGWLANSGGSARRGRWISQLAALGLLGPVDLNEKLESPHHEAVASPESDEAPPSREVSPIPGYAALVKDRLAPALTVGGTIEGWTLQALNSPADQPATALLELQSGSRRMVLLLSPRDDGQQAFLRTAGFNISYLKTYRNAPCAFEPEAVRRLADFLAAGAPRSESA